MIVKIILKKRILKIKINHRNLNMKNLLKIKILILSVNENLKPQQAKPIILKIKNTQKSLIQKTLKHLNSKRKLMKKK